MRASVLTFILTITITSPAEPFVLTQISNCKMRNHVLSQRMTLASPSVSSETASPETGFSMITLAGY
ncbi:hypothetical protein Y1Q_0000891 [Alligator mississippiensis]|uniref:Uncharacterized protein n=1 Tax=Alligator mississippiensis TaxID=8496 RepID=A0A151NDT9_ALLMI|nr:hypothetical protein Y1Q_0000891 [Alligator mississippiensis]